MAKFPTIEEFVQQVKERTLAECLIDGEPLGELIDSGDLVHVCRCKDCTYWDSEITQTAVPNMRSCIYWGRIGTLGIDYCSRAVRKEE